MAHDTPTAQTPLLNLISPRRTWRRNSPSNTLINHNLLTSSNPQHLPETGQTNATTLLQQSTSPILTNSYLLFSSAPLSQPEPSKKTSSQGKQPGTILPARAPLRSLTCTTHNGRSQFDRILTVTRNPARDRSQTLLRTAP
jgi:hypothetical protein